MSLLTPEQKQQIYEFEKLKLEFEREQQAARGRLQLEESEQAFKDNPFLAVGVMVGVFIGGGFGL